METRSPKDIPIRSSYLTFDYTNFLPALESGLIPLGGGELKNWGAKNGGIARFEAIRVPQELQSKFGGQSTVAGGSLPSAEEAEVVKALLRCEIESLPADKESPAPDSSSSVSFLHGSYRAARERRLRNAHGGIKDSIYLSLANGCRDNGVWVRPLGIARRYGDGFGPRRLDEASNRQGPAGVGAAGCGLNDSHAAVLAATMREFPFGRVVLDDNRFSAEGCRMLVESLGEGVVELSLCGLPLDLATPSLIAALSRGLPALTQLRLARTGLAPAAINELLAIIANRRGLEILDMSDNRLDDSAASALATLIGNSESRLTELYLAGNRLSRRGGAELLAAAERAPKLTVLDLSDNFLGEAAPGVGESCAAAVARLLAGPGLAHLDLAGNRFTIREAAVIKRGLDPNRTLLGFHFDRNCPAFIDPQGFLIIPDEPSDKNEPTRSAPTGVDPPRRRIHGLTRVRNPRPRHPPRAWRDACWLCDGWRQVDLSLKASDFTNQPVSLHLDLFDFEPLHVDFDSSSNVCISFWYPQDRPLVYRFSEADEESLFSLPGSVEHIGPAGPPCFVAPASIVNSWRSVDSDKIGLWNSDDGDRADLSKLFPPRSDRPVRRVAALSAKRRPWLFNQSVFAPYPQESSELLRRCFEFDLSVSRISGLSKTEDDRKDLIDFLWTQYRPIKEAYKALCCTSTVTSLWGLTSNGVTDFLTNTGIVDGKLLTLSACDIEFEKVNFSEKKHKYDQKGVLVRHKFLELLVRVCQAKFVLTKNLTGICEAVKKGFEENFSSKLANYDASIFRTSKYYNKYVDSVYKSNLGMLKEVYTAYSGLKTLPSKKKFTSLEEFRSLCSDSGLFNTALDDKQAVMSFYLSLSTCVDEINSDKMFEMYFEELLEGIARVSDIAGTGLARNESEQKELDEGNEQILLAKKIWFVLRQFYENVLSKTFKKTNEFANYRDPVEFE